MVYHLVLESPLFLVLILGVSLMLIDALYISRTSKKTKTTYIIISLAVVFLLMYSYLESVSDIIDGVVKNFVALIYFPTILEYIITLLISFIILIYSFISSKMKAIIKRINLLVFVINLFLFFLVIDQISRYDVDLSDRVSIYTNSNLMILLELSLIIFIVWMIGLVLYKIINVLILKTEKEKEDKVNLNTGNNFYQEPNLPSTMEELRNESFNSEPKIEYIYVEKEKEEIFSLEEYKEMKDLLEIIKKQKR